MRKTALLLAVLGLFLLGIAPAGALSPGYEEVPFTDGADCNFTGEEARYGTPGYPGNEVNPDTTESVLQKYIVFENRQGRSHESIDIRMDSVQYDLLSGDGPTSFLVYGTMRGNNAGVGVFVWHWTLTDLDGNPLGKTSGTLVGSWPWMVHNWRGPCSNP